MKNPLTKNEITLESPRYKNTEIFPQKKTEENAFLELYSVFLTIYLSDIKRRLNTRLQLDPARHVEPQSRLADARFRVATN